MELTLMERFVRTIEKSSTRQTRIKHLRIFNRWLTGHRLALGKVTDKDLKDYQKYLLMVRRCKPRTVSSYFRTLRLLYDWMIAIGVVESNPTKGVTTNRRSIVRLAMTQEQIRQYGNRWVQESMRDYLMFMTMVISVITPEEIVGIRVSDVHAYSPIPHIRLSPDEFVCINPEILPVMRNYVKSHQSQTFLFENDQCRPLSVNYVRKIRRDGLSKFKKIFNTKS